MIQYTWTTFNYCFCMREMGSSDDNAEIQIGLLFLNCIDIWLVLLLRQAEWSEWSEPSEWRRNERNGGGMEAEWQRNGWYDVSCGGMIQWKVEMADRNLRLAIMLRQVGWMAG